MVSIQSWKKDKIENLLRKAEGMGSKSRLAGPLQAEGGIASFINQGKEENGFMGSIPSGGLKEFPLDDFKFPNEVERK